MTKKLNLGLRGFAMLHNVSQRFLDDPKKAQSLSLGDLCRNVLMNKLDLEIPLLGELSAQASHRGYQSLKVQF
jgi:hypothetical protein